MTPEQLQRELAAGKLRPAYLLVGSEPLLRDDALAAIRRLVLGDAPADFDCDRLSGARATPAALLDAARTLPVLAPRRLVVLRDPEAQRGSGLTDAIAGLLGELDPAGGSVLVVVAERVDGRSRWVKAFGAESLVRCEAPTRPRELAAFARAEAERQGAALEPAAAELLVERVGPHLLALRREIEKAALLAGPGQSIARSHVAAGSSDTAEEPIWDLTDAIGDGRAGEAMRVLSRMLAAGTPPPVLLGALVSHFRRLLRLRGGGALSGAPFVLRKLERQAARYSERRLVACLRAIHATDLALKGAGELRPQLALERLVLGLAG